MSFRYELLLINKNCNKVIEAGYEAESVAQALFHVLQKDRKLCGCMLMIYCRRPKSKDLKYMGIYDGGSGRSMNGEICLNILSLANGEEYHLTNDGFRRCLI